MRIADHSVFLLLRLVPVFRIGRTGNRTNPRRLASPVYSTCRRTPERRRFALRNYVMLPAAIEQERLFVAERLLSEIERRHGLPHPAQRELHPVIVDRFLTAYLPETRDGEPAPSALEFAFSR